MRKLIMALAILQIGFGVYIMAQTYLEHSDPAGDAMAQGLGAVMLAVILLFNLPALLLAAINKLPMFALALTCMCPLLYVVLVGPGGI